MIRGRRLKLWAVVALGAAVAGLAAVVGIAASPSPALAAATAADGPMRVLLVAGDWQAQAKGGYIASRVQAVDPGVKWEVVNAYEATSSLTPQFLRRFDAVVVGDTFVRDFTDEQQRMLADYVRQGGGFILAGSFKLMRDAQNTVIEQLLPVTIGNDPIVKPMPVASVADHPVIRGIDWKAVPAFAGARAAQAKPGATVLLAGPGGEPLAVAWEVGAGRVLASPAIFSSGDYTGGFADSPAFGRYWAQAVRWAGEPAQGAAKAAWSNLRRNPAPTTVWYDVTIDASDAQESGAPINRGIFSVVGYPQLWSAGSQVAKDAFADLHPGGTQARVETMIDLLEPKNDNSSPSKFAWDKFQFASMHRFVNDADSFMQDVSGLGMEPVLLLDYDSQWLGITGKNNDAPDDPEEWAEFAAAAVQHYNGAKGDGYKPNIKYVEIWNEPNLTGFWRGSKKQYFELFNTVAKRIHRDYPGVLVGGPVVANTPDADPNGWLEEFLAKSGKYADYLIYHSYGDSPGRITADIRHWAKRFREVTGKTGPVVMVTESDFWIEGQSKFDYMLERERDLAGLGGDIIGFDHFSLLAYQEGGAYTFGIMNPDGAVIPHTYWPLWAFRNYRGAASAATVVVRDEKDEWAGSGLTVLSSTDPASETDSAVVFAKPALTDENNEHELAEAATHLNWRLTPAKSDRTLTVYAASMAGRKLLAVQRVSAGQATVDLDVKVTPHAVYSLTVEPAENVVPLVQVKPSATAVLLGEKLQITAEVTNLMEKPISGKVMLAGLPSDWDIQSVADENEEFSNLGFGQTYRVTFDVTAASPGQGAVPAVYAFVPVTVGDGEVALAPHSLAEQIAVTVPMSYQVQPNRIYVAPGEDVAFRLEVKNKLAQPIEGTSRMEVPKDWLVPQEQLYRLDGNQEGTLSFTLKVPAGASEGDYQASVVTEYAGVPFPAPITLIVKRFDPARPSVPLDLTTFFNRDGVSFDSKPGDGRLDGVGNCFAGEEFPASGSRQRYIGVTFQIPDLSDGRNNAVNAEGQTVATPEGRYSAVAFLAAATDGDKGGTLTFVYNDGTQEPAPLRVTDWYQVAKNGELPVAVFDHRHNADGDAGPADGQLFYAELPANSAKKLVKIVLPKADGLVIFAASLVQAQ